MTTKNPQLDPATLRREVEDELLLYSPESGETLLLNATAAAIAELCDGSRSASEITGVVLECVPGAARETVEADVARTLESLREKGMLA